ncbi:MAG: YibE/F family protein [Oscillospiraceae bacterium]|nr:YibE/F family protein [Oscillospiraceae bacterium]
MKQITEERQRQWIVYGITLLLSLGFLLAGNRVAMGGQRIFNPQGDYSIIAARVLHMLAEESSDYGEQNDLTLTTIRFEARVLSRGPLKNETIHCVQEIDSAYATDHTGVGRGDSVLLLVEEEASGETGYIFYNYMRTTPLLLLTALFIALVILFARKKGINTILSLCLTVLAIFTVLVPAVLTGRNIYLWTLMICVYIVTTNLLLVQGPSIKSLTAGLGCVSGVLVSGLLMLLMDRPMHITGLLDDESVFLLQLNPDHPINLKATVFCMILIGSVGALMDVTMSIVSALEEIRSKEPELPPAELMRSGFAIGKDMIGTMTNTLMLAYIGGSMGVILLVVNYSANLTQVLNREHIAVDILQSLVGSLSIITAIPITSFICSVFFPRQGIRVERYPE